MRNFFIVFGCFMLLTLAASAASVSYGNLVQFNNDLKLNSTSNTVALTIQKAANCHSNFLECYIGSTLVYSIPTNGLPTNNTVTLPLSVANGGSGGATNTGTGALVSSNSPTINTPIVLGLLTNSSLSASLPVFTDANKALVSKTIANTQLALGIQRGSNYISNDFSVTNTFTQAYSAVPVVVACGSTTNSFVGVTSITTSNFIVLANKTNQTFFWTAIGAP